MMFSDSRRLERPCLPNDTAVQRRAGEVAKRPTRSFVCNGGLGYRVGKGGIRHSRRSSGQGYSRSAAGRSQKGTVTLKPPVRPFVVEPWKPFHVTHCSMSGSA